MTAAYGRDLDLNLLRVLVAVADTGSVTAAASSLYLTQPAVSAALRRLQTAIGAPLFARRGRGLSLTTRGARLVTEARPHLIALLDAALLPPQFEAKTSDRTLRLGLSDATEPWLLPKLLRALSQEAPRMRLIVLPVQFRTAGQALLTRRIDVAVTVADELPPSILRSTLFTGGFECLFDPRHAKISKTLTERAYFAHEHVIVSYNGDLRGIVEDTLSRSRKIRCSVSSFGHIGAIVSGTALLATVPSRVASDVRLLYPHLRAAQLPFELRGAPMELLWPAALDADDACRFLRDKIVEEARDSGRAPRRRRSKAA